MGRVRGALLRHQRVVRMSLLALCVVVVGAQLRWVVFGGPTTFESLCAAIEKKRSYVELRGTVVLRGNLPAIAHSMTIAGKSKSARIKSDFRGKFRLFVVRGAGVTLVLKDMELSGGQAAKKSSKEAKKMPMLADGGSVLVYGGASVELHNVFFNHSKAANGAAIAAHDASSVTVRNCRFLNNAAWNTGGAIYLTNRSTVWTWSSSFERNKGSVKGGAVHANQGSFYRSVGCIYRRNAVKEEGGGGWVVGGEGTMAESIDDLFFENKAQYPSAKGGGVIVKHKGKLYVSNSRFVGNKVPTDVGNSIWLEPGGALGLLEGTPEAVVEWPDDVPGPTFARNSADVQLPSKGFMGR
ncbi:hypothetical protein CBR_g3536 [Chara braunii]|uniref:Right handed beta helix domain-containing protein n=1 Tax=Chara braunii TaxID=69332 RepID=A0A388KFJ6_CHABU|nr:hypothetical protein CBR_g3536 [Chara braunii]|eukprot:GBG68842.1 hypothetical protein CBR_g3536 [Chara braunii]